MIALITGAQRGIGLGIARSLANAGYKLALTSEVPPQDAEVVCALGEISALGGEVVYYQHDVGDIEASNRLLDSAEKDLGPISTFVSNAGVPPKVRGDMLEMSVESFDFVMDINLKGAFFLAQRIARRMLEHTRGPYQSMIFVTSMNAAVVTPQRAEYCMSKSAAAMMMKLYAARLAQSGIGVFEIRPGIIDTAMTAEVKDKYSALIEDGLVPAKRWGQPADIGSVVVPLVQGHFAYATGSVIPVDGGLSIHRF